MKLSKSELVAIRLQSDIEAALVLRDWNKARDAAIRLAAHAADRATREK
jgi:hypothetical protein